MSDLFETPFNLAGEKLDEGITPEGETHIREVARIEANKAQTKFPILEDAAEIKQLLDQRCDRCGKLSFSSLPHCAACHRELWSRQNGR